MKPPFAVKLHFITLLAFLGLAASHCWAQEKAVEALPEPTLEQRVSDLEAYINNTARTADVASKIPGPGPGHNAWQTASNQILSASMMSRGWEIGRAHV